MQLISAAPEMYQALQQVRKIIVDGAMVGFNPKDGDWADRLFASNATTSAALRKAEGKQ